jgi:hypothetical protein
MVHIAKWTDKGWGVPNEPDRRRLPVFFYRTEAGHEPVREWLKGLEAEDRKAIGIDLLRVQEQWPIGMPVCKSLGKGLWEVRTDPSRQAHGADPVLRSRGSHWRGARLS